MSHNNCFNQQVGTFDLVIAEDSEFNLTKDHVYVIINHLGSNLVEVKNDLGELEVYSTEYFRFYQGECVY